MNAMQIDLTDINARSWLVAYKVVGHMGDSLPPDVIGKLTQDIATEVSRAMLEFVDGVPIAD